MKLVYEPGEKEMIEKIHAQYGTLFRSEDAMDKIYGLTFKIANRALADYFLCGLLYDHLEDFDLGIDVQSIEFDSVQMSRSALREKLHRMIDDIL